MVTAASESESVPPVDPTDRTMKQLMNGGEQLLLLPVSEGDTRIDIKIMVPSAQGDSVHSLRTVF